MKKKAIVLLLVLSLVIGTFAGLSFMSASTALAGSESTFVTEEALSGEYITYTNGVPQITLSGSTVTICHTYDKTDYSTVLNDSAEILPDGSSKYVQIPVTTAWSKYIRMRSYAIALTEACQVVVSAYVRFPEMAAGTTADVLIGFATAAATNVVDGETTAVGNTWTKVTAVVSLAAGNTYFQLQTPTSSTGYTYAFDVCGISVKKVESKQIINGNGTEMVTDGNAPAAAGDTVFLGSQKITHFKTAGSTTSFNIGQDSVSGADVDGNGRYFAVAKIELTDSEASNSALRNKLPFSMTIDGFTAGEKYIVSAYAKLPAGSTDTVTAQLGTAATYAIHLAGGDSYLTHKSEVVTLTTEWQKIDFIVEYNGAGDGTTGSGDKYLGLILSAPAAVDVDAISIQKVGTKTVTNYGSECSYNTTGATTSNASVFGAGISTNYFNGTTEVKASNIVGIVNTTDAGYDGVGYFARPLTAHSDAWRNVTPFYFSFGSKVNVGEKYLVSAYVRLADSTTNVSAYFATATLTGHLLSSNRNQKSEDVALIANEWVKIEWVVENTDAAKDVYLGLVITKAAAVDFDCISIKQITGTETVDDITEVSKVVPFEVKTEGNGIATIVGFGQRGKIYYGMETTVVAIPNNSEFLGWYVGENCVSTDLEYTFIASEDGINSNEITAKFFTPNYLEFVGDFENGVYNGLKKDGCTLTIVEDRLDADNKVALVTGRSTGANGIWFVITPEMAELADEVKYQFKARLAEDVADVENTLARLTVRTDYILGDTSGTKYATGVANKALTSTDWTTYDVTVDIDANLPAGATLKTVQLYLTSVVNVNAESTSGTSTGYSLEYDDFSATFIKDSELVDINTVTIDVEGDATVKVNNGNAPQYVDADGNVKATVLSGSEFTVTATDNDNYTLDKIAYKDQKFGANLATDNVATLTAYGTATNLTAKFVATEGVDYVTFKYVVDGKENIVAKLAEEEAVAFTEANAPKIYGKVFNGFKVNDGEVVTVLPADFADGDIVEIVYTLEQVDEAEKPTVSVTGENVSVSTQDGQDATGKVAPYTIVTFTATGEDFSRWVIKGTDTTVSSKARYTCYVVGDVELEAVYGETDAPKAVVTVKAVDTTDGLVIVADRSTSEGVITTYGVIISEREEAGDIYVTDKGTYEDGRVIVSERNNGSTPNGTYVVTKGLKDANGNNYENGKTLYFRAYVIVDGAPVYSATSSAPITVTE